MKILSSQFLNVITYLGKSKSTTAAIWVNLSEKVVYFYFKLSRGFYKSAIKFLILRNLNFKLFCFKKHRGSVFFCQTDIVLGEKKSDNTFLVLSLCN